MAEISKKKLSAKVAEREKKEASDTDSPAIKKKKKKSFADGLKKAFEKPDSQKSKLETGVRDLAKALMTKKKEK